jgi:hypothetical protein
VQQYFGGGLRQTRYNCAVTHLDAEVIGELRRVAESVVKDVVLQEHNPRIPGLFRVCAFLTVHRHTNLEKASLDVFASPARRLVEVNDNEPVPSGLHIKCEWSVVRRIVS